MIELCEENLNKKLLKFESGFLVDMLVNLKF